VNNTFTFPVSVGTVEVEGTSQPSALAPASPVSTPAVALSGTESPNQSSLPCTSSNRTKKLLVKIVKATQKGSASKPEFTPIEVGYVEITANTANVSYVNQCIQDKWGDGYCVVSNDGLPVVDDRGTQG
jgi:hypothetical protein